MLRALLVRPLGHLRATIWAARVGKVMSAGMALAGFVSGSILLLFIAVFMGFAGSSETRLVAVEAALGERPARSLARTPLAVLSSGTRLLEVLELFLRERPVAILVDDARGPVGILTPERAQGVPRARLERLTAGDAMERIIELPADTTARAALHAMAQQQVDVVLLVDEQGILGAVTQADLLTAARFGGGAWGWTQP